MKWHQYLIILAMVLLVILGIAGIIISLGDPETTNVPSISETVPAALPRDPSPPVPDQGAAEILGEGRWDKGYTVCEVKLTNWLQREARVSVTVLAESPDGKTAYRSAQLNSQPLVLNQSETVTTKYFQFGSGPDIPLNAPFRCRVTGRIKATVTS